MLTTHTIDDARKVAGRLSESGPVALVPTMGALHVGHVSLIKRALELSPNVVVSIFVNPAQFNNPDDLIHYPRPIERDLELCLKSGAAMVFNPSAAEIYKPGEHEVIVDVPALTTTLEGACRPGHFVGVCRVVAKLFEIIRPAVACFGKKDYQQLKIIQAMAAGLNMPIGIEACQTVREPDGLACSSRNVRLKPEHRPAALSLHRALNQGRDLIIAGQSAPAAVEAAMARVMKEAGVAVDYAAVRSTDGLRAPARIDIRFKPVVCLVAGSVGEVRLIDNLEIK